jgi:preflagellin peptidase FlaK
LGFSLLAGLEAASLVLSFTVLAYASWKDWKEREVPDRVWMVYAPVGGVLTALRVGLYGKPGLAFWLTGLAFAFAVALALYYVGFWGGADSKALLCLSLSLPVMPELCQPILGLYILFIPFTVVFNAFLLTLTVVTYTALRNLWYKLQGKTLFQGFEGEPVARKILAVLACYRVKRERLPGNPGLSLAEAPTPDGRRSLSFRFKIECEKVSDEALAGLPEEVWVTPQLPVLVFITVGLAIALLFGDLVLTLVAWFLGLV